MIAPQPDMFPEVQLLPEEQPDDRYTLRDTLELCKRLAGVGEFDLDVAACKEAHCADAWFDVGQSGLLMHWWGNVWCNPPFSDIGAWVKKAWYEHYARHTQSISMLLPANRAEQPWWQEHVEQWRDGRGIGLRTHFLPGRVKFGFPGNPLGVGVGSPPFGCVLLVWSRS